MLISVVTVSHEPEHLPRAWQSLRQQSLGGWEWVVVANGRRRTDVIETLSQLRRDSPPPEGCSARFLDGHSLPRGQIGSLKRMGFSLAKGEMLVELDHDDELTPDCLERLAAAARLDRPQMLYSDWVDVQPGGRHVPYLEGHGWGYYPFTDHRGVKYTAVRAFPVTARSLCEIFYAPNHVRAWTRPGYLQSGGHSPEMAVADDQALLIASYLAGLEFVHLPSVLYLYHCRPERTSATEPGNAQIQMVQLELRDRCLHALVQEEMRRRGLPRYDLGGGLDCPPGYIPVDRDLHGGSGGLSCDVRQGLPLADNSVGVFRASDFLEHLTGPEAVAVLNDLYRCLAPGGWLLTHTPAVCDDQGRCGRGAYQDLSHQSYWSSNNWWYFTRREFQRYLPEIRCRFQAVRLMNHYPSDWHRLHLIPYVTADLMAVKDGQRVPGPLTC